MTITSRLFNGFMALVNLAIATLLARSAFNIGAGLPEMWPAAHTAGNYEGIGVFILLTIVLALLIVNLTRDIYQQGYKALIGRHWGEEEIKLKVDIPETDIDELVARIKATTASVVQTERREKAEEDHRVA